MAYSSINPEALRTDHAGMVSKDASSDSGVNKGGPVSGSAPATLSFGPSSSSSKASSSSASGTGFGFHQVVLPNFTIHSYITLFKYA